MVSEDQDISTELDSVVCRLMKLALKTARWRQQPLSNRWMQCKLFDLLTLTENAIEKKKLRYIQMIDMKALCYDQECPNVESATLSKLKEDCTANDIVNKYRYLAHSSEDTPDANNRSLEDDLLCKDFFYESVSTELNFTETVRSPSLVDIEQLVDIVTPKYTTKMFYEDNKTSLSRTRVWVDEDIGIKYSNDGIGVITGDIIHVNRNVVYTDNKKIHENTEDVKYFKPEIPHRRIRGKTMQDLDKYKVLENRKTKNRNILKINNNKKKKSSYNILAKTCSKNMSIISMRKSSKNLRRRSANTSPIRPFLSTSMTTQKVVNSTRKSEEVNECIVDTEADFHGLHINNLETNIAATKESLVIDIIMENNEETIAFRRTIGIDADDEQIFEQETTLASLTNVMKIDSFYDKCSLESEYSHQPTIFLLDINEPSTSKGVRHVSMDVQCGTDNICTEYPMLTPTTSLTKINSIFKSGIKIDDSKINLAVIPKSNDFGTSTERDLYPIAGMTPKIKATGIKIKDSATSFIDKVERGSIIHQADTMHTVSPEPNTFYSSTCMPLLKAVSSRLILDETGSEFCDSVRSSHKSPLNFKSISKSSSNTQSKSSVSKDITGNIRTCSKYCSRKLCCGGVYVHSYKEKQAIEDVVYQGEWQKYTADSASKKREYNTIIPRRIRNSATNKYKIIPTQNVKENQSKLINRLPIHNRNIKGMNGDSNKRQNKNIPLSNNGAEVTYRKEKAVKALAPPSKLPAKSVKPNITKLSYLTKKPSLTCNIVKRENDNPQRCKRKSYIPLYLKRKLVNNKDADVRFKRNLEKSAGGNNEIKTDLLNDLEVSNKHIENKILNIDFKPRNNVSYLIFRNEIEVTKNSSTDCESPMSALVNIEGKMYDTNETFFSSQSLNSSGGSSPKSIATIRTSTGPKVIPDRNYSTSSNRNNLANSQSENSSSKSYSKRDKITKKSQDKVLDNKENVPESSRKSKDTEASVVPKFAKNKNIFRAHISNEKNLAISNKISRHTSALNKPNIKVQPIPSLSAKHHDDIRSPKLSISKDSPAKSTLSSHSKSERDVEEITLIPITEVKKVMVHSEVRKENIIINIVENNLLKEWMNSTYNSKFEESQKSNSTLNSMRALIEERLDFVIQQSEIDQEIDSKTVVLGDERLDIIPGSTVSSLQDVMSRNSSYCEAIDNYDFDNSETIDNISFGSAIYSDCYGRPGNDSIINVSDTKPTVTDLELISFKSLTSASKLSEYFLAESSLNNTSDPFSTSDILATTSIRDIFERRNPPSTQVPATAVAMQAFSGFSMNSAPITGDRPDPINLIDSETGILAVEFTRLATSEELLISARSSGSYESCPVDDDTVVPNWLFQIISQQQSVNEEEESESDGVESLPFIGPVFDPNTTIVEPGASAGAGDGRGIHSDISEDTSGRGSSISSSDTSSGTQSTAILIDPTVFTSQYDRTRETIDSSSTVPFLIVTTESPDTSRAVAVGMDNTRNLGVLNSSGDPQVIPLALQATSDMDADVSSIDTDAPDSDN